MLKIIITATTLLTLIIGVEPIYGVSTVDRLLTKKDQNYPEKDALNIESANLDPQKIGTAKIGDAVKVVINKDLFRKGLEIDTTGYGQYYAKLNTNDASGRTAAPSERISRIQLKRSAPSAYGGVEFGGKMTQDSFLYMRVGVEGDNHLKGSTISAPSLRESYSGYYAPSISSGLGVQYQFGQKISIRGEAITNDRSRLSGLISQNYTDGSSIKGRENRFMLGFSYKFD